MDFTSDQRLVITKAIIKLFNSFWASGLAHGRRSGRNRFENNPMGFYEKDRNILPSHYTRPLYMTWHIRYLELRRARVNLGSSLSIMPLSTFKAMGFPRDKWAACRGSEVIHHFTIGFINLDLIIGTYE